jgi:uncharacterized protein DUF5636
MHSTKIAHAPEKDVLDFLVKTFEPDGPLYRSDMEAYATLAKFLSNDGEVAEAAAQMAGRLGGLLLNMSQHCPDGVSDPFLEALRTLGDFYGFNPTHCYTLNNQVSTEAFHWVVSQKSLFNDAFTRPHGEYTHAVQWLLMAFRFGSLLPNCGLVRSLRRLHRQGGKTVYWLQGSTNCGPNPPMEFSGGLLRRAGRRFHDQHQMQDVSLSAVRHPKFSCTLARILVREDPNKVEKPWKQGWRICTIPPL